MEKTNAMKKLLVLTTAVAASLSSLAQDIHFSQFYETSILRNPALTGIFSEDYKVTAVYRSQWNTIGKPFQTGAISAEMRNAVGHSGDFVSVGVFAYNDKAGSVGLKTSGFYPALNYNKALDDRHGSYLSVGFTAGYLQRNFDLSKATFNNQYLNGLVVPSLGPGEEIPEVKLNHWDLGMGTSFNSGIGEGDKVTYFVGLAAYHFTRPSRSFYKDRNANRLETRWSGNLGINFQIDDIWSIQVHGNYTQQGKYTEKVAGGFVRWSKLDNNNKENFSFNTGCFYRFGDAIVPTIRLDYKAQSFGISYDINTSQLKAATHMRGGLEITAFISGYKGGADYNRLCPRF